MSYDVLILSRRLSPLGQYVANFFNADFVYSDEEVQSKLSSKTYRVLVLDEVEVDELDLSRCEALLKTDYMRNIPLVVLSSSCAMPNKIRALEIGCDDFVDSNTERDEVCARVTKSIFRHIASAQLSRRISQATEGARSAMTDNSDLGENIKFLLQTHSCDNLDELGQQFFATIERYGLSCSLQMRSDFEIKNMEAHGMAKDLESQLLLQLMDRGRYVDLGGRTIVNHDRVSLLIKNMPVDDAEKYAAIKANALCLVQGVNARVRSLQDRSKLINEKEALHKLSVDVNAVIATLYSSYHDVMRQVVSDVEQVAERIQHRLPQLGLIEADEQFLTQITDGLIITTNNAFSDSLRGNDAFEYLIKPA